ncbi:AMIN domain-containing protein [Nodosilinea sp. LEGE 06152]|uniref:AMIN domain-containing protein n=1 Tax=Nodosilinea sp. LEGE 06152 TaxID=2777966 RepID=UPI00187E86C8|nr:AMIN domain-containing protein [Nodosilinea sp. LEGE 06152]MBE9157159.1 AMIN domain-containing protein [Nodosilinea sp. LEGE 06152]
MEHSTQPFAVPRPGAIGHRLGGWAGAGLIVSTLLIISPAARAETLAAWQFDPSTQQLTLTLPSGITPQYRVEANPARIVLTLPQTQLGAVATQQTYSGAVSQVSLSQVNDATVVVLDLAADTVLAADGASLISIAAGEQTRWVLTALAAPGGAPTAAVPDSTSVSGNAPVPGSSQMIVELPVIPGNNPQLGFPEAGTGRLSTSAANLMLPSDINSLTNLPETLPVDPFNLGQPGEQVSVPSLAELDAVVGPVAVAPQAANPTSLEPPTSEAAQPGAIATAPTPTAAGASPVLTLEPPAAPGTATAPAPAVATPSQPEVATLPAAPPAPEPEALPAIDSETSGVPIAVTPPELPTPAQPVVPAQPVAQPEAIAVVPPEAPPATAPSTAAPAATEPLVTAPETAAAAEARSAAGAIAAEPPVLPNSAADGAIATQPDAISQEPPPVATVPVEMAQTDPNLLTVPTAPTTTSQGSVVPPESPVMLAAAGEPILFGSPLPDSGDQAALPSVINPTPAEPPLSPDTLVAAGTVLELRYVGNEPLDLNISSSQNQVLLLAHDIRDPITNGIVAPAGSQLIGQFEPTPQGQRWVSKMLISPAGQRVDFASTTEYMVGSPDISSPRLAAGAGLGALALMLVTSFSGIGLLGGALIGATTAVGTSPQTVVIEPNQIIQVQVIQDVPRAIPIAAAPEQSREWGAGGW